MDSNNKFLIRLIFCISFVLVFGVTTQTAVAYQAYTHNALTGKVDELFKQWDKGDSPGAAVGIFKDGRIIYARGYGIANLEYALPWTPQTPSRIGSISKQFIAMCIAILAEQGKISLDDNIRKYIPDWPEYDGPVQLSHLVHHTSGVREYLTLVSLMGKPEGSGYIYTPKELVRTLSRQKEINFKPGDEYSYSNSGYFLLSEIVSRVSGLETSAFAKKYIFDPLGMNNTHFHDDPNMIVKNRAYGYSPKKEDGYRLDILRLKVIGDLGVFTTIKDFLKWDQNFYENKLGDGTQNLINMMLTCGKLNNGEEIPYAFGLNISRYGGLKIVSHGGSAVGYQAQYMQFPDQRFSVVILSNLSNFSTGRIARKIADLYLADQFTESPTPRQRQRPQEERPKPVKLTSSQLQTYAGNYYSDELDITYILDVESNNLVLKLRETSSILTAYSTDNFGWGRRRLEFKRDGEKRIIGFILQAGRVKNLKFQKIRE
ncbi:serine hydrolase [bacterium]|nr:serine hydrolase [bacterium]